MVSGEKPAMIFDNLRTSEERILEGEGIHLTVTATNLKQENCKTTIQLFLDGQVIQTKSDTFAANESKEISFDLIPPVGNHTASIGNSMVTHLTVLKCQNLDLTKEKLLTYLSPKAKPAETELIQKENRYIVKASGWDFYHAEDAYATIYLPQISGDFVATVKISSFGPRTSEWYRSGLFVRNDISQSFDVDRGSLGSVLMFSTPGRAGIEYDEFGNGCMHKAASENLPENSKTPIWIKLERHGNRFTGYVSLDGSKWIIKRQTNMIPGLHEAIDLGLAAGAPDQKQYRVEFSDWQIKIETRAKAQKQSQL